MNRIAELYRGLSRPLQWAVLGLVALCAHFVLIEPALLHTSSLNERADELDQDLATARTKRDRSLQMTRTVKGGRARFGDVQLPGRNPDDRMELFAEVVGSILKDHGVDAYRLESRPAVQVSQGALRDTFSRNGKAVMRAVSDCRFSASPETVSAVLAALEQSPVVGGVSNVQLRRTDAMRGDDVRRELTVDLAIEAWVLDVQRNARRGGEE